MLAKREMRLSAATRDELVRAAHRRLLDRAAQGTIDTADPLRQLAELDPAWRDPDASWSLASSLLRVSERCQVQASGSKRDRSRINLVYSVTLTVYDEARLRRLKRSAAIRLHASD
ncbi:MAG TPA: hypothetical protein VNO20_03485 [Solirubrobacterales bacterium]|nr:hypothetical protein [Solirubrobacterales bacterium]